MKRAICIFLLLFFVKLGAHAQDMPECYYFYYIAHDATTPVSKLFEIIDDAVITSNRSNAPTIFYLSNEDKPIVVRLNTKNSNEQDLYDKLKPALNRKDYHDVGGKKDVDRILDIIADTDYIIEGEQIPNVYFTFYVGKNFWSSGYNNDIIAALFVALSIDKEIENGVYFDVYSHEAESIKEYCSDDKTAGEDNLFGEKNYNGINEIVNVYEY